MGRKRTPGLYKREGIWHIDKKFNGRRLCESTGTGDLEEAEKYLARRLETLRQAAIYGVRPQRIFREAATKYLLDYQHKPRIRDYAYVLKVLDPFIGNLPLEAVHMGSLQDYIQKRQESGVKSRTINYGLQVTRRILNLAASEWLDERGLTWLQTAPKIKLLPEDDKRKPCPLSLEEQEKLFNELPLHLKRMALFAVNTGCRETEVCSLRWEWEVKLPTSGSVFIIPGTIVKNREDRLVVLNPIAASVIEEVRGEHPEYVFVYKNKPVERILNSAWRRARIRADLSNIRVHDLKHTFGRRLRSAGVSYEDRQDLLGHKSGRITTHYSMAELDNLLNAANKVCGRKGGVTLAILKHTRNATPAPAKVPQGDFGRLQKVG